ncbi:MAG TPA: tRNA guanosine(34) transglycosylase Tgt [Candidatus Gracilibacteria bacterium]|nr:tRNA guanosine(34) transglycosylase Tgt [Candidatus Gracilibacteria bacterium]
MPIFKLIAQEGKARSGELTTTHGIVQTPFFMPIATVGANKSGLEPRDIRELGFELILANTYHLNLRPGADFIESKGGLAKFMAWNGPILTDSGGFQVLSLAHMRKITEEGVSFASHLDGSKVFLSPEKVVEIEAKLGIDIAMVLDECTPFPCDYEYAKQSLLRTTRWAERAKKHWQKIGADQFQHLFAIVQGSTYQDLRIESARQLSELDFPGYAVGGVVESPHQLNEVLDYTVDCLPANKPRYLMGVGTPENILEAVERGIDMFDCVLPTRNARHAKIFSSAGSYNVSRAIYRDDDLPLDPECNCAICQTYSRGYLRHLFQAQEILALRLASWHNLAFYSNLMQNIRQSIRQNTFAEYKKTTLAKMQNGFVQHESGLVSRRKHF